MIIADNKRITRVFVAVAIIQFLDSLHLKYPEVGHEKLKELAAARAALVKRDDSGKSEPKIAKLRAKAAKLLAELLLLYLRMKAITKIVASSSLLLALLVAWMLLAPFLGCSTVRRNYVAQPRADGGVSLQIKATKRYWLPMSPEGPFPKESLDYDIEIAGPGKAWKNRGFDDGFFYKAEEIKCKHAYWNFGYAWMDKDRKYVSLNFYLASGPDDFTKADVNGRYLRDKQGDPGAQNASQK